MGMNKRKFKVKVETFSPGRRSAISYKEDKDKMRFTCLWNK
jgi:hypothetical protein